MTDPNGATEARPIHEVFLPMARQVGVAISDRGIWRMDDFRHDEELRVEEKSNSDGTTTLRYYRQRVHDGCIEFRNIASAGVDGLVIGDETITHSERLGSNEEDVYNSVSDTDVDFHDLFSETDSKEDSSTEGTSIKVTAEGEGGVEGFGSFKSSVEAEAHAEFSQSESKSSTHESGGDNESVIPKGVHARIVETRARSDGTAQATASGDFSFVIGAGKHSGGGFVGHHNVHFRSWSQFVAVVKREAPDNWPMVKSFKAHPLTGRALAAATKVLDGTLRFTLAFTGRIKRSYQVLTLQPDGTYS